MKSKQEIIDFIDSKKDGITQSEIAIFYYGYFKALKSKLLLECWVYALNKYGFKKLAEYKHKRINDINNDKRNKFFEIYNKDKRFKELGYKKARKLLLNVYGLNYGLTTISSYYQKLK